MELANTRLCIICMCRPREVRVQCGHLFACTECIEGISICAICRKPIYANYNIRHTAGGPGSGSASDLGRGYSSGAANESGRGSGSDSQPPGEGIGAAKGVKGSVGPSPALSGYISSGSESFVDIVQKPCLVCNQPATLLFSCSCLGESLQAASQAKLIVVCATCAASWSCPNCRRPHTLADFEELSIRTSSPSSGSSALAPSASFAAGGINSSEPLASVVGLSRNGVQHLLICVLCDGDPTKDLFTHAWNLLGEALGTSSPLEEALEDANVYSQLHEAGTRWRNQHVLSITATGGPHAGLRALGAGSNQRKMEGAARLALAVSAFCMSTCGTLPDPDNDGAFAALVGRVRTARQRVWTEDQPEDEWMLESHDDMSPPSKRVAVTSSVTGSDVMIDVAMKGLVGALPSETHLKALDKFCQPSPEAQVVKVNVNAGVKTLAERCAGENTLIELPKTLEALNRMHLAAEVCRVCLGSRSHGKAAVDCKAVVVAPTVPLVRQHVEVVRQVTSLRAKEVIGNAEVDAWRREPWSEAICDVDVLVTTPQLFLDSLDARFVELNTFCVLVVDECQHCSGSHPFARIFKEHYSLLRPRGQIRVLGLSQQLVKSKLKATTVERLHVIKRFEVLMDSRKMEDSIVQDASAMPCGGLGSGSMVPTTASYIAGSGHESAFVGSEKGSMAPATAGRGAESRTTDAQSYRTLSSGLRATP
jgi:hypothetical protein